MAESGFSSEVSITVEAATLSEAPEGPLLAGTTIIRRRLQMLGPTRLLIPFDTIWNNKIYQAYAGCVFLGRTDNTTDRVIQAELPGGVDFFLNPQNRLYHLTLIAVDPLDKDVDFGEMLAPRPHPIAELTYDAADPDGDAKEDLIYGSVIPGCGPNFENPIGRVSRS